MNQFILTDINRPVEQLTSKVSSAEISLAGASHWSVKKRTLQGGVSTGVDVVEIDNGALCLSLLPTRGMGIWKGEYQGHSLGWNSPVKNPVHPQWVNLTDRNGLGWLSGFNELMCRCGLSSIGPPGNDKGGNPLENPLPLHGRIANLPADNLSVEIDERGDGTISVTGIVNECGLFTSQLQLKSTLRTTAGSNKFQIEDEIKNTSSKPAEFQLLYHTNIGEPFLEEGTTFHAAMKEISPRDTTAAEGIETWKTFGPPETGFAEQVYFFDLLANEFNKSQVLLKNKTGDLGLSMTIAKEQLPYFILWKNTQATADGYCVGLEPATNYPNHRSFERQQNRVQALQPNETYCTSLEIAIHTSVDEVTKVETEIAKLQERLKPVIHSKPQTNISSSE
ncbi:hypothetical protein MNBD_PLANCTO02-1821 [hydrothermal vent metagenome]|uniref:DUF4432 domain-containing protein n=1 Tax=hydrothermal vent metagenome TaxID=652676 RepID=A0A3B1DGJ8_9ZZZZ